MQANIDLHMFPMKELLKTNRKSCQKPSKIIVFDLDETLGSFSQLYALSDSIHQIYNEPLPTNHLFKLIDTFPGFLRPNILRILKKLVNARENGKCLAIVLYTNNQGPKKWAQDIVDYFAYKLKKPVFDYVIHAYKANGQRVEPLRTTHDKNYEDLLNCLGMPNKTQVCFIDDQFHTLSVHPNVSYIPVDPYVYTPPPIKIAEKYYTNMHPTGHRQIFIGALAGKLGRRFKNNAEYHSDVNSDTSASHQHLIHGLGRFLEYPGGILRSCKSKIHTKRYRISKKKNNKTKKHRRRKKRSRRS